MSEKFEANVTKRALFIAHDASRSGGSLTLLRFLEKIKSQGQIYFEILLLNGGPLVDEFTALGKIHFGYVEADSKISYLVNKAWAKLMNKDPDALKVKVVNSLKDKRFDIIWGNTILALPWVYLFTSLPNIKTILAVHELEILTQTHYPNKALFNQHLSAIDQIVAVSHAVKNNLVYRHKVPASKIIITHPYIPTDFSITIEKFQMKKTLGLNNEYVFGIIGYHGLIKGSDLLPQLAALIQKRKPDLNFKLLFLGGTPNDSMEQYMMLDAEKLNVGDKLLYVPRTEQPANVMNVFDAYLMISREESFSIATLHAMQLKKPIFLFEKIGGPNELVNEKSAYVAPYLDINKMADHLIEFVSDRTKADYQAEAAFKKAQQFNNEDTFNQLNSILS